jgi:hypothetical protein
MFGVNIGSPLAEGYTLCWSSGVGVFSGLHPRGAAPPVGVFCPFRAAPPPRGAALLVGVFCPFRAGRSAGPPPRGASSTRGLLHEGPPPRGASSTRGLPHEGPPPRGASPTRGLLHEGPPPRGASSTRGLLHEGPPPRGASSTRGLLHEGLHPPLGYFAPSGQVVLRPLPRGAALPVRVFCPFRAGRSAPPPTRGGTPR